MSLMGSSCAACTTYKIGRKGRREGREEGGGRRVGKEKKERGGNYRLGFSLLFSSLRSHSTLEVSESVEG